MPNKPIQSIHGELMKKRVYRIENSNLLLCKSIIETFSKLDLFEEILLEK
jgi:hypothetical protein